MRPLSGARELVFPSPCYPVKSLSENTFNSALARIERMLDLLDACATPSDMAVPGFKFHELMGNRKGNFSISVTGNYRITFRFEGEDALDVDLEDYR